MKSSILALSAVLILSFSPEARANDVIEKCESVMADLEVSNATEGCACFANEIGEDMSDEYIALDTAEWEAKAPQAMKDASDVCFPGLQES